MSVLRHLVRLLHGVWFRRLFAVRVSSQLSDGVFQVALASYALFSDDQPTPAAIAAALAVVLLPFSVLGPFAGVLLDRWSRRQVLRWAQPRAGRDRGGRGRGRRRGPPRPRLLRRGAALPVGQPLPARRPVGALPHTVARDDLLTANALTPTAGHARVHRRAGRGRRRAGSRPGGRVGR